MSSSSLSLELTGLDEYVEYRLEVRAFTVKGSGPYAYINCITEQDGKTITCHPFCIQFTLTFSTVNRKNEQELSKERMNKI